MDCPFCKDGLMVLPNHNIRCGTCGSTWISLNAIMEGVKLISNSMPGYCPTPPNWTNDTK